MPSTISSTGKGVAKNASRTTKDDAPKQQPEKEASEHGSATPRVNQVTKQDAASTGPIPPILRYIPRSRRKEGESPFGESTGRNNKSKATKGDADSITSLKESVTVPTLRMWQVKVNRPPIPGFVISSKDSNDLPSVWTKEGFDPNAYKLMEKAGYDFQNPATLGKVVEVKPHGLNET